MAILTFSTVITPERHLSASNSKQKTPSSNLSIMQAFQASVQPTLEYICKQMLTDLRDYTASKL